MDYYAKARVLDYPSNYLCIAPSSLYYFQDLVSKELMHPAQALCECTYVIYKEFMHTVVH